MTELTPLFNSNVQPRRRIREKPGLWHCNCRKLLGPYQLNSAHLKRCPVCGVARHRDPTVAANVRLAPHSTASDGAGRATPPR
jgi:hypothetical protein